MARTASWGPKGNRGVKATVYRAFERAEWGVRDACRIDVHAGSCQQVELLDPLP